MLITCGVFAILWWWSDAINFDVLRFVKIIAKIMLHSQSNKAIIYVRALFFGPLFSLIAESLEEDY